jgi:hypothetical protein
MRFFIITCGQSVPHNSRSGAAVSGGHVQPVAADRGKKKGAEENALRAGPSPCMSRPVNSLISSPRNAAPNSKVTAMAPYKQNPLRARTPMLQGSK